MSGGKARDGLEHRRSKRAAEEGRVLETGIYNAKRSSIPHAHDHDTKYH